MILNLNQLRAFYTAAKLRSITLAADELMVTPPAISKQIKLFEENIEMKLVSREGNSLRLTEVGKVMFRNCEEIFRKIKQVEIDLEDMSRAKSGVLRIGCPQTPAEYIMPHLIARFKEIYPAIRIVLDQGTSSEMADSLYAHQNELAVIRRKTEEKKLKIRSFAREDVILVALPGSKHILTSEISVTQLPQIPLIIQKEGSATRDVIYEYFKRFRLKPMVALESKSVDLIKAMVKKDYGVAFLVKSSVRKELGAKSLKQVRILEGPPLIEYGIAYVGRKTLSPPAWAFLSMVEKNADTILSEIDREF